MQEVAIVKQLQQDKAILSVNKKAECSKCGMCLFPQNANAVEFTATNSVGANQGDTVLIEVKDGGKLPALLLVFLVPLLLILVSTVVALSVIKIEVWALWLSLISLAFWFLVLPLIDKGLKKSTKFSVDIIKIVSTNKENDNE